jgi:cytoskeletal protein RodZ
MSEAARVSSVHAGAAAGALLGAAREASGMSIDTVAQQLKLAPRQVRALEAGEFSHLPGRTFVRGFIRNYARLLRLDPEQVLGALPAGGAMPSLEAPTLHPTAPAMGELPTTVEPSKAGWTRWAIPLTLAAVVAAAAVYEWKRPVASIRPAQAKEVRGSQRSRNGLRAAGQDGSAARESGCRHRAGRSAHFPRGGDGQRACASRQQRRGASTVAGARSRQSWRRR